MACRILGGIICCFDQTSDCKYLIPLGWDIVPALTCTTSYLTDRITTGFEFEAALGASAGASVGPEDDSGVGAMESAHFSASGGFQVELHPSTFCRDIFE